MLFPTNGLMPDLIKDKTEQILKYCKKSVVTVKLSLDGLHGDHDALRNTPGCFDKTMQTYQLLSELLEQYTHFELGINTVFCSENQDKMDEIIDFVQDLTNVKTHTISMVRGNLADSHYKEVDYEKYRHAINRLEDNLKNRTSRIYRFRGARLKAAQDIIQRRLIHQTLLDQQRLIPCYAGRLNLVLTETGDVYPCEILSTNFGNVRDYNYNMKEKVVPVMHIVDIAEEAMKQLNITPLIKAIRGGTDGSQLSYKGLPCPNIFAGGHNFHGRYEYVPVESMIKAIQVICKIAELTAEKYS